MHVPSQRQFREMVRYLGSAEGCWKESKVATKSLCCANALGHVYAVLVRIFLERLRAVDERLLIGPNRTEIGLIRKLKQDLLRQDQEMVEELRQQQRRELDRLEELRARADAGD